MTRYELAAIVFLAMGALDYVWALYTIAVTKHRMLRAGLFAVMILMLSGASTIGYVSDPLMLLPAALGAFVGTCLAVYRAGCVEVQTKPAQPGRECSTCRGLRYVRPGTGLREFDPCPECTAVIRCDPYQCDGHYCTCKEA